MLKFREPQTEAEAQERFALLENRGDLLLVADASPDWEGWVRPTFVYPTADLVEA